MISGVFGLPGSGKTLFLSYLGSRAVAGKPVNCHMQTFGHFNYYERVYTTFPLEGAFQLDPDMLGTYDIQNSLILIDEIMMFFDSRDYAKFSERHKFFFSQARKFGVDCIYASQSYSDCDKKIRGVTDSLYYVERSFFHFSAVRPIRAFFNIEHGQIVQGYEFGGPLETFYYDRRKCYQLTDTNATVSKFDLEPLPELEQWVEKS